MGLRTSEEASARGVGPAQRSQATGPGAPVTETLAGQSEGSRPARVKLSLGFTSNRRVTANPADKTEEQTAMCMRLGLT